MNARELLMAMRERDSERAFNALYRQEYGRLLRIAVFFLHNDDLAKEAALDTLATLWERRHEMEVPDDLRRFTFTMVKRKALNLLQREARYTDLENGSPAPTPDLQHPTPQDLIEQEEIFEAYNSLVASLPGRCREVFCCVKEDGLSYAETAERLGISTKTVDAQLQKALRILRRGLAPRATRPAGRRFTLLFL